MGVAFAGVKVGDRVKFAEEKQAYTVQARNDRYLVCTKPFNARRTVLYTIIDLDEQVRGPENLIFGMGAETREQCEEMLVRLTNPPPVEVWDYKATPPRPTGETVPGEKSEVSWRHRIPLRAERVMYAKATP